MLARCGRVYRLAAGPLKPRLPPGEAATISGSASASIAELDHAGNPAFKADPDALFASKDQILYPAHRAEVEELSKSQVLFQDPQTAPDSVIVRVVRLSDPVSSPVTRVVRNRQFGIREDEWVSVLGLGLALSCVFGSLGFWQLRRMTYKRELIDKRRDRLAQPALTGGGIPWSEEDCDLFEHRQAEMRGFLDHRREMLVGPRSFSFGTSEMSAGRDALDTVGYLVVTPLILEDGSQVLVNRGAISLRAIRERPREFPTLTKVRGVLVSGELSGGSEWWRLSNRPSDRKFLFLNVKDLASASGITRNFDLAKLLLLTATSEEPLGRFATAGGRRSVYVRKRPEDFLVFYGDEHTHLWYAAQWFACAGLLAAMSLWRSYALARRWRW